MHSFLQDLLFALRTCRRTPVFAVTAVATLALGIGATTAIFSTVNAALLRPFPYPRPDDLYAIGQRFVDGSLTSGLIAPVEFTRLNRAGSSVMRAAGVNRFDTTLLRDDAAPMRTEVYSATEGFFEVFGLPLTLGRTFTHEDHLLRGPGFVILSYRAWRDIFGRHGRPLRRINPQAARHHPQYCQQGTELATSGAAPHHRLSATNVLISTGAT